MLKQYKFSNINESSSDYNLIKRAIAVAKEKGFDDLITDPYNRLNKILCDGKVVLLYIRTKNVYCVYLTDHGTVLDDTIEFDDKKCKPYKDCNPFKLDSMREYISDYIICYKTTDIITKVNFINKDGFTLKDWIDIDKEYGSIDSRCDVYGYHIIFYGIRMCNMINVHGEKKFDGFFERILWLDTYHSYLEVNTIDNSNVMILNQDGSIKVNEYYNYNEYVSRYYDSAVDYTIFAFRRTDNMTNYDIYDYDFNLICSDVYEIDEIEGWLDKFKCIILTKFGNGRLIYNIIGTEGNKLVSNDWFDSMDYIDDGLYSVEKNNTYNIVDIKRLKILMDDWCDECASIDIRYMGIESAVAIQSDGKCNVLVIDDNHNKLLFKEPVDDIIVKDFMFVLENGHKYLVWGNPVNKTRVDKIKTHKYFDGICWITVDNKIDIVDTNDDQTFCDKYMNGHKFDACTDIMHLYPIVKYNGKYSYINIESFKPLFDDSKMVWFDKVYPYREIEEFKVFPVVQNGEEKLLDVDGDEFDPNY